jgi:hypothetical protein
MDEKAARPARGLWIPGAHPDLRTDLLTRLDSSFGDLSSDNLLSQIEHIENMIVNVCETDILTVLGRRDRDAEHALRNVIYVNGQAYILKLRRDVERDRLFHVILQDSMSPDLNSITAYRHRVVKIESAVGSFENIHIVLPTSLGSKWVDEANEHISEIFRAGYFWLEQRLQRALAVLESAFESRSLELFRRQFFIHNREAVANRVWLVMVADGRVLYAVDADVVDRALLGARSFADVLQQAPASIAAALLANSIPLEHSFSRQAIESRQTIEMDLTNTPYNDIAESFRAAQGSIYADRMSLTPLAGDRRAWLLAAYPTEIGSGIQEVLDAAGADLEQYFAVTRDKVRPAVKNYARRADKGRLAELAGRFVWGIIDSASG